MKTHSRPLAFILGVGISGMSFGFFVAPAAELRGRVFDSATKLGLEGAIATLDALPTNGIPEFTAEADLFGFFVISNIPAGSFRLGATQPGYTPSVQDETFSSGTSLSRDLPLVRLPGDPSRFSVLVEVACVKSGHRLASVPVRVQRFAGLADATPDATFTLVTDNSGRAAIRGGVSGYYTFSVNHATNGTPRAGWEFYVTPARTFLSAPHLAQALLKPVPRQLTILVTGFDPTAGMAGLSNQPLKNVYVELEGVNPSATSEVLVPARVGVTATNGQATFTDLPGIAWRATAKRLGYTAASIVVFPDGSDALPVPAQEVSLSAELATLILLPDSPYLVQTMMTGLVVRVEGVKDSNTEGIVRTNIIIGFDPPGPPPLFAATLVPGLLAGSYHVNVSGSVTSAPITSGAMVSTGKFEVFFTGRDTVELTPNTNNNRMIALTPQPASVRVRFHAADDMGQFPVANAAGVFTNQPAYARRPVSGAQFAESSVAYQLKPDRRMVPFGTDDSGEIRLHILPGVYGVQIPTLVEYFGSDMQLYDATTGTSLAHGWPFEVNPGMAPFPVSPHHALGLRFSSGHEYELDLYVRAKTYDLRGEVKPDPLDPVSQRIVVVSGTNSIVTGANELSGADGGFAKVTGPGLTITNGLLLPLAGASITNANPPAANAVFVFEDREPGTHTVSVMHPRNTFTAHSGGATLAVTLPDWGPPGIVDGGDVADAAAGLFPLQTRILAGAGSAPAFTATHGVMSDTIRVDLREWDPLANGGAGAYGPPTTLTNPAYFFPGSLGSLLHRYPGPAEFRMDAREWDIYFTINSTQWFRTTLEATNTGFVFTNNAYRFGPSHNLIGPITETYSFIVKAVSDADPTLFIDGATVSIAGGGAVLTPYSNGSYAGSYLPTGATHDFWEGTSKYDVALTGASEITLTVKMKRGLGSTGLVLDATNSTPIVNARANLYDRFGNLLRTATTGTNGIYTMAAISNSQTVFLDYTAPGYAQKRVRVNPGNSDLNLTNSLVALGQPVILTNELNRYGMFLPGVRKSGNEGFFHDDGALAPLKMSWRMVAHEHEFALELPEFDSGPGGPRPDSFAVLDDPIIETWLVDARGFAGNPQLTTSTNLVLPATTNPPAIREWLNQVKAGGFGNVPTYRTGMRTIVGTNVEVTSSIPLWQLPPGQFTPVFVALTQRGSAALQPLVYYGGETNKTLRGEPLPPWMAFAADLFGYVAGVKEATGVDVTEDQVKRFIPSGRYKALPEFTANILTNEGFLTYEYALGVSVKEGQDTPRAGLLAFAPRTLGLEFGASMSFGMDGLQESFSLGVNADFTLTSSNLPGFSPAILGDDAEAEGTLTVEAGTLFNAVVPNQRLSVLEVLNHVGGSVAASVEFNLKPLTSKLPYVGPALLALDQSGGLQLLGTVSGGIGAVVTNRWRTVYPESKPGSIIPGGLDQNYRRHFAGGQEEIPNPVTTGENYLNVCFNFGVGAKVKMLRESVTGSVNLSLGGYQCGGLNAVSLTPNGFADWPPFTHIAGAVNLSADVTVDAYVAQFTKELFNVDLITFEWQYSTESVFSLMQVGELSTVLLPANAEATQFLGVGPDRVKKFFGPGSTATASGALAYTDIDTNSGSMVLRLALASGAGYAAPVLVAGAPGILSVAATRLTNGAWLAAWSEISAGDIGSAYPASVIKFSLSDTNAANWSAPAVIASLPDAGTDLRFTVSGSLTGLVWLHTAEGPLSATRAASGSTWNGTVWSVPVELFAAQTVARFDASGSGGSASPPALLAWSDGDGALRSLTWNGTTTTGPHLVASNAGVAFGLAVNPDGEFHLAWNSTTEDVRLARFNGVSAWTLLGTPVTGVAAENVQLAALPNGGSNTWLLAWIDANEASGLNYAYATAAGGILKPATPAAFGDGGRYSHLHLIAQANLTGRIIARHTDPSHNIVVREFIATPSGIAPWLVNATATGGGIQFQLLANPGQSYRLQGSSNLVDWLDLTTLTPTNSPELFLDPGTLSRRFYRAVTP